MRRLLLGLACATLLLPACGDDDDGDRAAVTSIPERTTSSTSSTTTTEPQVPPPDVIPADVDLITEQYVEQVLNALYEVSLQTVIHVRQEGAVDERALSLIEATHSSDVFAQQVNDLIDLALTGFPGLQPDPGPMRLSVVTLLDASTTCVLAEVRTDASALLDSPTPREQAERDFIRLFPASSEQRESGLNPTAWVIDQFPVTLDGTAPDLDCGRAR